MTARVERAARAEGRRDAAAETAHRETAHAETAHAETGQKDLEVGRRVLRLEAQGLDALAKSLGDGFVRILDTLAAVSGRITVTGMGKSGHISSKIAATLASTGTPAFFMHPGEASHGDLGMITDQDVVMALSNSGETDELLTILPVIRRLGVPLIALTGRPQSTLAQNATVHIDVSVEKEACPLGLAPTSSTTASLAMGDALAVALLEVRGFTEEDFALSHPGGNLGRRLLLRVSDIMHTGDAIPLVTTVTTLKDTLLEMTAKGLGMAGVIETGSEKLVGIYTDGDLRRTFEKMPDIKKALVRDFMTPDCVTIDEDRIASEALKLMQDKKINALMIVDDNLQVQGALNMHDLLRAGVV